MGWTEWTPSRQRRLGLEARIGSIAARQAGSAHEIGIDAAGSLAPVGDTPDHERLSALAVAGGEDALHAGRERLRIHADVAATVQGDPKLLDDAGLKYTCHISVGDAAEVIASYCHDRKLDQIIMGTRGAGAVANMLMGSVASKVLHLVDVPVLLVK